MNSFQYGQIVKSKAGRDINKLFVIIDMQGEYLYLVDGTLRRLENPKKKKCKHIQPLNIIIEPIKSRIENGDQLTNAEIRKQIVMVQWFQDSPKEV